MEEKFTEEQINNLKNFKTADGSHFTGLIYDPNIEIVDRVVSDSSTLDKVQEFSKIYHKRMKSVKEKYISELMRFEESEDEINRIRSYLRMTKDQLMKFCWRKTNGGKQAKEGTGPAEQVRSPREAGRAFREDSLALQCRGGG